MKKIIFIELLHHHECIENPYLSFKDKGYDTKAVLGEFVAHKLKNIQEYKNEFYILEQPVRRLFPKGNIYKKVTYILREYIEISKNVRELKKIIKKEKPEYLYINTIESPFLIPLILYLLGLKKIKIFLTIHNTNRLKVSFKKYIFFDFLIKRLIKKAYKIILLGEYLSFDDQSIKNKTIYFNNRIIKKTNVEKFEKITFVMPGSLNYKDKDYESVIKGFGKLLEHDKKYQNKVQLVFLGQMNDKVAKWIQLYKIEKITISFDYYVGEEDMEKYMGGAHYAIISTYKDSIYGKYKISGAFGDAVGFNVPILLSENYAPQYRSDNIVRFKNDALEKILINIMEGKQDLY